MAREIGWGLPATARELRKWRTRAFAIPDAGIRATALAAQRHKRGNAEGAGLFWTLPQSRSPVLLNLLISYQTAWDYLDSVNEHGAAAGQESGRQLHLALVDAVDPTRPASDYYRFHPANDDGGYLGALVERCRSLVTLLPLYVRIQPLLVREARRANVQAINHELDPPRRESALRAWSRHEFASSDAATWFEFAAAAGAGLSIYALFALAAEPTGSAEPSRTYSAYFPWVSALATMLDSYVDRVGDVDSGAHVYVGYYSSPQEAVHGIKRLLRRSLIECRSLPGAERHKVIIASMAALYLSKDSARTRELRATTRVLAAGGGSLTRLLLPVLRLWRLVYAQRSA